MERRETEEGKGEREKTVGLWKTVTKDFPSLVQDIKAWFPSVRNRFNVLTNPWIIGGAAVVTICSMMASAISFRRIAEAQLKRAEIEEKRAQAKADKSKAKAERGKAKERAEVAEAAEERARQAAVAPRGGGGGRRLSWP